MTKIITALNVIWCILFLSIMSMGGSTAQIPTNAKVAFLVFAVLVFYVNVKLEKRHSVSHKKD